MFKRIIPCLDIRENMVVKGEKFLDLKKLGKPNLLAEKYYLQGADEIVILNINKDRILSFCKTINSISKKVYIPITAGGNINTIKDAINVFNSGADRITLNSSLFKKKLLEEVSNKFGSQCIVASIDVKRKKKKWWVYINGGKKKTNMEVLKWIKICKKRGAGEILLTSIDRDGTNLGFDIDLIKYVSSNVSLPLISSGGGGGGGFIENIVDVFKETKSNSVLLASALHYKKTNIGDIKKKVSFFFNKKIFR